MSYLQHRFCFSTRQHTNHLNLCCSKIKKITSSTTTSKTSRRKTRPSTNKTAQNFSHQPNQQNQLRNRSLRIHPHQPTNQPDQGSGWKGSKWLDMSPSPNHTRPDLPMERWRMGWSGSILRGRNFTRRTVVGFFGFEGNLWGPNNHVTSCFCLLFGGGFCFSIFFCGLRKKLSKKIRNLREPTWN